MNLTWVVNGLVILIALLISVQTLRLVDTKLRFILRIGMYSCIVTILLISFENDLESYMLATGVIANLTVMATNGGYMPIERSKYEQYFKRSTENMDSNYVLDSGVQKIVDDGKGKILILGDRIPIIIFRLRMLASIGDILIWTGIAIPFFSYFNPFQ